VDTFPVKNIARRKEGRGCCRIAWEGAARKTPI